MNGISDLTNVFWMEQTLANTFSASVQAGLMGALVWGVQHVGRRWLSARQWSWLWGLVLLRLVLPVVPASSLSWQNLWPSPPTILTERLAWEVTPVLWQNLEAQAGAPQSLTEWMARPARVATTAKASELKSGLIVLWMAGGLCSLLAALRVHRRFAQRMRDAEACADESVLSLWRDCCQRAEISREIPVWQGDFQQPAVWGFRRPRLLLPMDLEATLSERQLRLVMLHELAHVRQRDVAIQTLLVAVRGWHWWNPVFWWASGHFRNLREQACDQFALQVVDGSSVHEYRELLMAMAARVQPVGWSVRLPASLLGFLPGWVRQRSLKERMLLLDQNLGGRWSKSVCAGLMIFLAAGGMTKGVMRRDDATPVNEDPFQGYLEASEEFEQPAEGEKQPEPSVTRAYDLGPALTRIASQSKSREEAWQYLRPSLVHLLRSCAGYQTTDDDWAGERLQREGELLVVNASENAHEELSRCLLAWGENGLSQICVWAQFLTSPRDLATETGIEWQYLEAFGGGEVKELAAREHSGDPVIQATTALDAYCGVVVATLGHEQVEKLLTAAQADRQTNLLQSPKVTVFNSQRAFIVDGTQRPFVVGVKHGADGIKRPKITVIDEGLRLDIRPTQRDATEVQLDARVALSHIDEVRTASARLGGEMTTIQLPSVQRRRVDVASLMQDGQSLLIGFLPTPQEERYLYVFLTAKILGEF
jgi:beta-lactamase regulating signal transducer with metallopeptidase domain